MSEEYDTDMIINELRHCADLTSDEHTALLMLMAATVLEELEELNEKFNKAQSAIRAARGVIHHNTLAYDILNDYLNSE